jgi:hypothetical protein
VQFLRSIATHIIFRTALYLKNYRSGPLPKVVSFLPQSPHWAQLLALTRPHEWSRQAMYRVMRVLAANLKPKQLQLFLESVVLETVREDIRENGRMHPLYRRTLEKSMFKAAAFFQGFLFPLLNVRRSPPPQASVFTGSPTSVKLHFEGGEYCSCNAGSQKNSQSSLRCCPLHYQRVRLLRYVL